MLGKAREVVINTSEKVEEKVTLEMALDALDEGYYAQAREYAADLRHKSCRRKKPVARPSSWVPQLLTRPTTCGARSRRTTSCWPRVICKKPAATDFPRSVWLKVCSCWARAWR